MSNKLSATEKLLGRAKKLNLKAKILVKSKGHYRRHSSLGSTSVPKKVIEIDGNRFSIGGAQLYLDKKELMNKPVEITAEKIRISLMQFLDRGGKLIETEDVLPDEYYQVKSNPKNRR